MIIILNKQRQQRKNFNNSAKGQKMSKRFYLQWHITNQCGNRCVHCYQQGNYGGPEVTHEKAVLILEDFLSLCSRLNADSYLAITGGDPFLNRDFKPILTAASSKCFWVSILANPENVTEQNLEWLEELITKKCQLLWKRFMRPGLRGGLLPGGRLQGLAIVE